MSAIPASQRQRLVVDDLHLRYGRTEVLRGVSLELPDGVTALLGRNGAGKTSLIRCIAGVTQWQRGGIWVEGVDAGRDPVAARRRVGYVPERGGLPPEARVDRFLLYAAAAKGISRRLRSDEVERVVMEAGLDAHADRVVGNLSKGFRQRVVLAQALLGEPGVLVLDEPTSGLDDETLEHLYGFVGAYGAAHAVLLATHVQADVNAVCARSIVMRDGLMANGLGAPETGGAAP